MRRSSRLPSYRLHKQSGQAVVTLSDGLGGRKDVLLGRHGTPESHDEYQRVLVEWLASGKRLPAPPSRHADLTVNELILAYWQHVETYYVKNGEPTSEQDTIRQALRFVRKLYGHTRAGGFGPLALKAVREEMVRHPVTRKVKAVDPDTDQTAPSLKVLRVGLARRYINKQVSRIKRMFAWAVGEELLPAEVHAALLRVQGLKKGKGQAREKPRIKPAPTAHVEAVLPVVPPTVAAMIQVQLLCCCRPQDVVNLRVEDIDRSGPVWEYRPPVYKTEHHNDDDLPERDRVVFIGPRAQAVLAEVIGGRTSGYIFSPSASEVRRNAARKEGRKSPMTPSQHARMLRASRRVDKPWGEKYDVASYRRAIRRACEKLGLPVWSPLQLRHLGGTAVRKRYGLEASQAVLGHQELGVTQVYAEVDADLARKVASEMG